MFLDDHRSARLRRQLAWRVAIFGGLVLVAFAVIFFRLWQLQVLSVDKYRAAAQSNRLREIKVQAPRGEIVDRHGRVLVKNRVGYALRITPDQLPEDERERRRLYRRLGRLLRMRPAVIDRRVRRQLRELPFSTTTVKHDVARETFMYIDERREDFRGVEVEPVFLREYPHHTIGAHLFGHLGEVSKEELDDPHYAGAVMGDRVGKAGVEQQYDRFLRGRNGATRVEVDALGNLRGHLRDRSPHQGERLRLALDLDVQRTGQAALARGTGRGAFAVMDVHNGEVLGLGSHPSFDPNLFAEVVRESDYKALTAQDNGAPLTNRAVAGGYPTGSTFKLVTAVAALEGGLIRPDTVLNDPGSLTVGNVVFKNAGGVAHGALALRQALTVSSDVFFYQLGRDMDSHGNGQLLQTWARRLGLGRRTGIDLPEEAPGFVPSKAWRNRSFRRFSRCMKRRKPTPAEISVGNADGRTGPGRSATTSTSRSARATWPPTRCRWPWPTRPSPTAGRCCGPGSASGSRTRPVRRSGSSSRGPRGGSRSRPRTGARSWRACAARRARRAAPRPRSSRASRSRSPGRPARPRRGSAAPTSPGTSPSRRGPTPSTWSP